jgi:hypothetical protein
MMRIALAAYLSLVTLAGPWCCCCVGLRLLAGLLPQSVVEPAEPYEVVHTCCQHAAPVKTSRPAVPEQPSDNPQSPDCPCRQHMERVAAVPPAMVEAQTALQADPVFLGIVIAPAVLTDGTAKLAQHVAHLTGENNLLPFLSAADLRCALHIMRC